MTVAGTLPGHYRLRASVARRSRATKLEARGARLKLPVAKKPVFAKIGPGLGLGYRRNATAGTWVVRAADGQGGNWTKAIGTADDFDEADVLDFWQAQDRARAIARVGRNGDEDQTCRFIKACRGCHGPLPRVGRFVGIGRPPLLAPGLGTSARGESTAGIA
jgi:hypothetical protein